MKMQWTASVTHINRSVWQKVLARQAFVADAQSFYMTAKAAATNIYRELLYVTESEILKNKKVLDLRRRHCQTLTGTQCLPRQGGRAVCHSASRLLHLSSIQLV